jgi:lysophospholipase L1-like esterase
MGTWTGTWGAAPTFAVGPQFNLQTVRQYARISQGGSRVRLRLSNETGTFPVTLGPVRVALGLDGGHIDPATSRPVTFGGWDTVTLQPGVALNSDPVDFAVPPLATLAVTFFTPRYTPPSVFHNDGGQTAYVSPCGVECLDAAAIADPILHPHRFYLTRIDVEGPSAGALVTFGDSITDGGSAGLDTLQRWPDQLAERLAGEGIPLGVVNAGISGNRIWHDQPELAFGAAALARFDRDVLGVPGVRYLTIMLGINDIGHPSHAGLTDQAPSASAIIAGHKQMIDRAHDAGITVFGATLTPYQGPGIPRFFTAEGERSRQAVNAWIRTSGAYDRVIDFDVAVRDPAEPTRIRSAFDCGDSLHPNGAGYRAMAETIDIGWFA